MPEGMISYSSLIHIFFIKQIFLVIYKLISDTIPESIARLYE